MAIRKSEMLFTIDEYLAIERRSEDRHEFLDGYIFAMAGESGRHADISTNLTTLVATQLRNTPCRARAKDTKVHSGPTPRPGSIKGLFSYPDLVVICREPLYHDEHQDVVMNPAVIFEVLSESTESFDRGEKFHRYQMWNPTLRDYVLVAQSRPVIEHYARQMDGSWSYRIYTGLESKLEIATIHCALPLAEVYERITFPQEDTEAVDETEAVEN